MRKAIGAAKKKNDQLDARQSREKCFFPDK
jgi:hypothetical protein